MQAQVQEIHNQRDIIAQLRDDNITMKQQLESQEVRVCVRVWVRAKVRVGVKVSVDSGSG